MGGRCLLKLHLPCIALLDPDRTPMLVARRRALILLRRNMNDQIVGDDRSSLTQLDHGQIVWSQFQAAGDQFAEDLLPVVQLAAYAHLRIVVGKRSPEI